MDKTQILDKMNEIFSEVMDLDNLKLQETNSADDIEEWDSLTHIQVITEIEKEFNLRFTTREIEDFQTVGDMINKVISKN